jgi:hypothetical protein
MKRGRLRSPSLAISPVLLAWLGIIWCTPTHAQTSPALPQIALREALRSAQT